MEELKSRYITAEDFKQLFGIDLYANLNEDDNPSNKVNAFLFRIEDTIACKVNETNGMAVDVEFENFSDYQKKEYKLALLYQAYYEYKNGELWNDSGYDADTGVVANKNYINQISISSRAMQHLKSAGLIRRKIHDGRGDYYGFWR